MSEGRSSGSITRAKPNLVKLPDIASEKVHVLEANILLLADWVGRQNWLICFKVLKILFLEVVKYLISSRENELPLLLTEALVP